MFKFEHIPILLMTSRQNQLQEDTYFRVMRLLQENPRLSQRELATLLGISLGGVNYCLRALVGKGWLKMQNFNHSPNKLAYAYLLTPKGMAQKASLTALFLKRKMAEFDLLRNEIESLHEEMHHTAGNCADELSS